MSKAGRIQWVSKNQALKLVHGKPCAICGAPATCAVREIGDGQYIVIVPACDDHGLMAQGLGYLVAFPDPIPMFNERSIK